MFKAYVINLDRDIDRLTAFQASARTAGLDVERIVGVLGAEIEAAHDVSRYFMEGVVVPQKVLSALKPGEIGNYASHLRVLQRMLAGGDDVGLVFEDDCMVPLGFGAMVLDALTKVPSDWDFIRLSNEPKRAYVVLDQLTGGRELVRYSKISNSAMAYLVSRRGAEKFLAPRLRTLAFDEDLRRSWRFNLSQYGVLPMPIELQPVASSIDTLGHRLARHPILRRLKQPTDSPREMIHRIVHNLGQLGPKNWALCAALNLQRTVSRRVSKTARFSPQPRVLRLTS
jgi:glycosyl transferase, family 25